ncbi:hypothetical protein, partial [Candidatus Villigracilis saccharophilus]|uniref:hypothetical protein n=1 Tax=Candidatus Villigracilis saccharophilus TaxID=3140684 RepID=UPI0031F0A0E2
MIRILSALNIYSPKQIQGGQRSIRDNSSLPYVMFAGLIATNPFSGIRRYIRHSRPCSDRDIQNIVTCFNSFTSLPDRF